MNTWIIGLLVFSMISPVFYTLSMLKGQAKPHKVTRFIVWLASVAGILGVIGSPNFAGVIFAAIFFIRATYLLIMSFIYGVGGSMKLDRYCLAIALFALVIYFITGNGLLAVIFGILADLIGYIPTFVKTWHSPKSEDPLFFGIEMIAALCGVIAVGELRVDILFPVYFAVSAGTVLFLVYRKKLFRV